MSTITDLVQDLEDEITDTTLADVADAIQDRRIQATKDMIASDEDDRKAVDKFFYHYTGRKRRQTSTVEVAFQSPNYLLVRSEMYSGKKAKYDDDGDGTYHAGWIVGPDPDQDSGFFIHRLDHTRKLEDPDYDWTKQELRKRMGFSREWQGGDIEPGEFYRVQGDIRMKQLDYHDVDKVVQETADKTSREEIREQKNAAAEEHEDEILGATADYLRIETGRMSGPSITFTGPEPLLRQSDPDTDKLQQVQDDLGISEDAVRAYQDERDGWQMLTADRRKEAIRSLYADDARNRLADMLGREVDEDAIQDEAEDQVRTRLDEEQGRVNRQIGNHVLIFSNAVEHPDAWRDDHVVVPDASKLFVVHDEHRNQEIELDRGVYLINQLDRHDRR